MSNRYYLKDLKGSVTSVLYNQILPASFLSNFLVAAQISLLLSSTTNSLISQLLQRECSISTAPIISSADVISVLSSFQALLAWKSLTEILDLFSTLYLLVLSTISNIIYHLLLETSSLTYIFNLIAVKGNIY